MTLTDTRPTIPDRYPYGSAGAARTEARDWAEAVSWLGDRTHYWAEHLTETTIPAVDPR